MSELPSEEALLSVRADEFEEAGIAQPWAGAAILLPPWPEEGCMCDAFKAVGDGLQRETTDRCGNLGWAMDGAWSIHGDDAWSIHGDHGDEVTP